MRAPVLAVFVLAAFAACSDLKRADEAAPGDAGGGDTTDGTGADGGDTPSTPGDAAADVGQPPVDFACDEPWTAASKKKSACNPRQVKVIDADGPVDPVGLAIARTPAGRVGVAYHYPAFIDEGDMRLVHFVPKTSSFTPDVITRSTGAFSQAGYNVALAASAPDTLHLLAHDVDDTLSGDVLHFRLAAGKEPLVPPSGEVVVSGVPRRTVLGFAVSPTGADVFATARLVTGAQDGGGSIGKVVFRRKQGSGAFAPLQDLTDDELLDNAPGVGAASLFVDPSGQLGAAFHHCESLNVSSPRYRTFDGTMWSLRKTIDNAAMDGLSGYGVRLAIHGTKKYAAYFHRKANQAPPATADLRVASWSLANEASTIEVLDQGIPSEDPQSPQYRVAMAVDVYGLVHLAIVRPTSASAGYLEYKRQTRVNGETKWLSDIVDPAVVSASTQTFVDLVVDETGRPHIAYLSGSQARYATRYDR